VRSEKKVRSLARVIEASDEFVHPTISGGVVGSHLRSKE
jgi:hypothetical protein